MNAEVDKFVKDSEKWQEEIKKLRAIILKTNLEENFKWRLPCYSHSGSNIVIIQPFKACLALMFFKGKLLKDSAGVLSEIGPNSQSARRIEFESSKDITKLASTIKAYIKEAITIEESGQKVTVKKKSESIPEELTKMFSKSAKLKKAFDSLTPGRQRAYIIHFSSAKQSTTRQSRIEKCIPSILAGKGFNER